MKTTKNRKMLFVIFVSFVVFVTERRPLAVTLDAYGS